VEPDAPAPAPPEPAEPAADTEPEGAEPEMPAVRGGGFDVAPDHSIVPVFYATDRAATGSRHPDSWYEAERGELSLGVLEVSIPLDHRLGTLEAPSIWRLEFRSTPGRHVMLRAIEPLDQATFFDVLRERVLGSPEKNAFVFIHGYNVSFRDAARRTGQIAYDLKFAGAPILYSWPARGSFEQYPRDGNNAEWTEPDLERFLLDVAEWSGAEALHVIAHSMGNRALVGALARIAPKIAAEDGPLVDEVLLTAPDIDADVFKNLVAEMKKATERITLYASRNDNALKVSKVFNGLPRAGDATGGVVIVNGIDTIDASAVDTSLIGHSYFGDNRSVLSDMFTLLESRNPPSKRFGLQPARFDGKQYWVFQP
jgi:esterase/lipase superfamily enzyme